jgi:ribosomal-protein-alanine N-acetyltransferase
MSQVQYSIRPMRLNDLDRVREIDQLSFSLPWPDSAFKYELIENQSSSCWVVEAPSAQGEPGSAQVIAMCVVWLVVDEAHIATIAVHPQYRGQGIGKLLLDHILQDAVRRGLLSALLEVRAGNQVAIQMYRQFGFEEVGRRPRYYQDNHEDAVLMTLELADWRVGCESR